eukprot:TRINITY_DN12217_c0_g1_i11.p1 TRINITY_DN12217_c0_g1~~TRINITY_DN12217_c0_g1_i11.p1  ORF type:complete len:150 (+),score=47.05 TRINITY_DN12217_c0_g1_i11:104-553(+)
MQVDEQTQKISAGFAINWMNMKDGETGVQHWSSDQIQATAEEEQVAHIPSAIIQCKAVSREINFSSQELVNNLRVKQRVLFNGNCIEEWNFVFGFVIPGSTNTWQSTIEAAGEGKMIPPEVLSGNLVIETHFLDGDSLVCKSSLRIFYE